MHRLPLGIRNLPGPGAQRPSPPPQLTPLPPPHPGPPAHALRQHHPPHPAATTCPAGPALGAFHAVRRPSAMRAWLTRGLGTSANQVRWRGRVPLLGDTNAVDQAILALDKWLGRVDADHSAKPLSAKIIADKPGDIGDRCTDGAGTSLP